MISTPKHPNMLTEFVNISPKLRAVVNEIPIVTIDQFKELASPGDIVITSGKMSTYSTSIQH